MTDEARARVTPPSSHGRWTSFAANDPRPRRRTRALPEEGNDRHRVRVELGTTELRRLE